VSNRGRNNLAHFPPAFVLRAWEPNRGVSKLWVWDRMLWSENNWNALPAEAQRGTVSLRSLDNTCMALGDASENSRWNQALETEVAPTIERILGCEPQHGALDPLVVSLERVCPNTELLGHFAFSSVVRVHGHPPVYQSEGKSQQYLRQLEDSRLRRQLWERLSASRRLYLVMLHSDSLSISDWGTIPLLTQVGELLLLPISPKHAVLAAPRSIGSGVLRELLSKLPLADVSEAVYGTQICLWQRSGEDLANPDQKIAAAERVRSNMNRWRHLIALRTSIHDDLTS
jgi:hypothetical protein